MMLKTQLEQLKRTYGLIVEIYGQIILFIIFPFCYFTKLYIRKNGTLKAVFQGCFTISYIYICRTIQRKEKVAGR